MIKPIVCNIMNNFKRKTIAIASAFTVLLLLMVFVYSKSIASYELPDTPNHRIDYIKIKQSIEEKRLNFSGEYSDKLTSAQMSELIEDTRKQIMRLILEELFPYWYGTRWGFYGTTVIPGKGEIACGYFVSTILRDAGFRVERVKMAQQASEKIIKTLTTEPFIKRFSNKPIKYFVNVVKSEGPGLYIVGLDIHTGFIINTGNDIYFVHSSYKQPYCVVKEKAIESVILSNSKYRVIGKISDDDTLIEKWLTAENIITKTQ